MKDNAQSDLHFFRPLVPGFSEKLSLPDNFIKQMSCMSNDGSTGTAVLVSPNGKSWNVDFYKENGTTYIGGEGWKELAHANNLQQGYFLVLHYKGNMIFNFSAFDRSTCEVNYPCVAKTDKGKKIKEEISDGEGSDIIQEAAEPSYKKQKRKGLSDAKDKKGSSTHRRCASDAWFVVTMKESNLNGRRCFVRIPTEFVDSCGVFTRAIGSKLRVLRLRDPKGVMWRIGLFHPSMSHAIYISKGWMAFARANELKVGDLCIFEFLPKCNGQVRMSVKIHKNGGTARTKNPPVRLENATEQKYLSRDVHFIADVKDYNIRRNFMYIPHEFSMSSLAGECRELTIRNQKGQTWEVGLNCRIRKKRRKEISMSRGWLEFANENQLESGDRCIFKITSEGKNKKVVEVQVVKTPNNANE